MSLRAKLMTSLSLAICLFTAASYAIQRGIVFPSFLALEDDLARDNLARVMRAIDNEIGHLDAFTADWGAWDDTVVFLADRNEEYANANLSKAYYEGGIFSAAYYVDLEGRVVWGKARDPANDYEDIRVTQLDAAQWPLTHPLLANHDITKGTSGIFVGDRGPMLVASRPIITSEKKGPQRGWLVLLRQLDEEAVTELGQQTSLFFELLPYGGPGLHGADAAAHTALAAGAESHLQRIDDQEMRAYAAKYDVFGDPAAMVRVTLGRDVTARGSAPMVFAAWSNVGASALLLLALLVLLGHYVVTPITCLTEHAVEIGESDDLRARLDSPRQDEIGALAREFDSMVDRLADSRAKLLELARQGGRSEVATSVLHNVGNVLNSVNVSKDMLQSKLLAIDGATMGKLLDLLLQHREDLGEFITNDPAGRHLPRFLEAFVEQLRQTQGAMQDECTQLGQSIDHLRALVDAQQEFAGRAGVAEPTSLPQLVDQAIRVAKARGNARIVTFVHDVPEGLAVVRIQKHRVLEVLVNLVCNACDAVEAAGRPDPRVTVTVRLHAPERVRIVVADNGTGIAPEIRDKIFQHGFTTKPGGHGFGLHASAITMREIGGSLSAESEGLGRGATFCLEVPVEATEDAGARPKGHA